MMPAALPSASAFVSFELLRRYKVARAAPSGGVQIAMPTPPINQGWGIFNAFEQTALRPC